MNTLQQDRITNYRWSILTPHNPITISPMRWQYRNHNHFKSQLCNYRLVFCGFTTNNGSRDGLLDSVIKWISWSPLAYFAAELAFLTTPFSSFTIHLSATRSIKTPLPSVSPPHEYGSHLSFYPLIFSSGLSSCWNLHGHPSCLLNAMPFPVHTCLLCAFPSLRLINK